MVQTQRAKALIQGFMHYHESGYSIPEIAKVFKMDFSSVYGYLQEIADANGVSRDSLLERNPYRLSAHRMSHSTINVKPVDIQNELSTLLTDVDNLIDQIKNTKGN